MIDYRNKPFLLFFNSIIKYNSFLNIVLPNNKIIITPTDHMDIFIEAENIIKVKADLEQLVKKNKYLKIKYR